MSIRIGTVALLLIAAGFLTPAPAWPDDAQKQSAVDRQLEQRGFEILGAVNRIENAAVHSWHDLDRRHLIFNTGPSRDYLVTLKIGCNALLFARQIEFSGKGGAVGRYDRVVAIDATGGQDECPIKALHQLRRIRR